jgi:hypothetical protein
VKSGRNIKKDHNNSSGKCSDEKGDDNVEGDKVVQAKNPTKRLAKKSKKKVEKYGGIWALCYRDDEKHLLQYGSTV